MPNSLGVDGGHAARPGEVRLEGLTCSFSGFTAVNRVDLAIGHGEFFSLLGPSGCGKTSILRMIAGFQRPSAGRILIGSRDVTPLGPERRSIGIVTQHYALFPNLSVFENVAFGLRVRKRAKAEVVERVVGTLAKVGLSGLEKRMPHALSGGQKQRVALARAIVVEPDVLLLDEPLSALDARIRADMRSWLKTLQHNLGITTIFVTHDQQEALSMSDRLAVLNAGQVEQVGSPREVYERPVSSFVARFIGDANLLRAMALTADKLEVEGLGHIEVRGHGGAEGSPRELVLRPEDLAFAPAPDGSWTIEKLEFGGSVVNCRLASGETKIVVQMARHEIDAGVAIGSRALVAPRPGARLFLTGSAQPSCV